MDFEGFFKSFSLILELFVPGFVFVKTFCFFGKPSSDSFESTAVTSLVISYIFKLIVDLLETFIKMSDLVANAIAIVLAFVCSLIIVKIKVSGCLNFFTGWIGRVTVSENFWQEIFDVNKGSTIRFFTEYNNLDVMITGDVKRFDICDDGECCIALENYTVEYCEGDCEGEIYAPKAENNGPVMYVNTRDIHGLEVTYGRKNKENKNKGK